MVKSNPRTCEFNFLHQQFFFNITLKKKKRRRRKKKESKDLKQ